MTPHNPYEDTARAKKVIAILGVLPPTRSQAQNDLLATFLEQLPTAQRDVYGLLAGCKTAPSDTTWGMVVAAVRARHVPGSGEAMDIRAEVKKPDFDADARQQFHSPAHRYRADQCPRCERIGRALSDAFDLGMTTTIRAVGL